MITTMLASSRRAKSRTHPSDIVFSIVPISEFEVLSSLFLFAYFVDIKKVCFATGDARWKYRILESNAIAKGLFISYFIPVLNLRLSIRNPLLKLKHNAIIILIIGLVWILYSELFNVQGFCPKK